MLNSTVVKAMRGELNRINPTVVEGAEDIMGAEGSTHEADTFSWSERNQHQSNRRNRTMSNREFADLQRMQRMGRNMGFMSENFEAPMSRSQFDSLRRMVNQQRMGSQVIRGDIASLPRRDMKRADYIGEIELIQGSILDEERKKNRDVKDAPMEGILGGLIPDMHNITQEELRDEKMKNRNMKDAESNFDKLSKEIAEEYEEKGKSPEEAMEIGRATAAKVGRRKYGERGMVEKSIAGRKKKMEAQGYNDKLDESMGMTHRESSMKQSMKDRRDESKGMEKGMGRRAYQRVKTMDAEGLTPISNPSVDEAFDVGNQVGLDVAEQEVMNENPSVEVNYGAEGDVVDFTQGVASKLGFRIGGLSASVLTVGIAALAGYRFAKR
jgi:hypothetical protein